MITDIEPDDTKKEFLFMRSTKVMCACCGSSLDLEGCTIPEVVGISKEFKRIHKNSCSYEEWKEKYEKHMRKMMHDKVAREL